MNPLISIVVPVYNVEKYLQRCINSIINQTYKNLEIILVDDGSQDNCGLMCDQYLDIDKRIKVIHKKNGGLSSARNIGIENAQGEFITFIDSDDYVTNTYVEYLYDLIKKYNTKISISSHIVLYSSGKTILPQDLKDNEFSKKEVFERILYHNGIDLSAWAKLYKTDLFDSIRFPEGRLFEDAATTYKLIDKCDKIACGFNGNYYYCIRNDSITGKKFSLQKLDLVKFTGEMCDYIKKEFPELESACRRRYIYSCFSTLSQMVNSNIRFKKEEKYLIDTIKKERYKILKDKSAPNRDKLAIILLMFGRETYKFFWNRYLKLTKRY